MARASLYVDVDLDDIDTNDLLEELENRYINRNDQFRLKKIIGESIEPKLELFLRVVDGYSVYELEILFQEKATQIPVPKEQIPIPFF